MVKAFIFDIGKVILDTDFPVLYKSFSKATGLREDFLDTDYRENFQDYLLGNKNFIDLHKTAKKEGCKLNFQEFKKVWIDEISKLTTLNEELLELLTKLRENYTLVVLTNNTEGRHFIDKKLGVHTYFDFVLESFQEKVKKPDPRFFKMALKKANCKPEQAVFIDDQQRHVDAAQALGINSFVFTDTNELIKDIKKLGIKC